MKILQVPPVPFERTFTVHLILPVKPVFTGSAVPPIVSPLLVASTDVLNTGLNRSVCGLAGALVPTNSASITYLVPTCASFSGIVQAIVAATVPLFVFTIDVSSDWVESIPPMNPFCVTTDGVPSVFENTCDPDKFGVSGAAWFVSHKYPNTIITGPLALKFAVAASLDTSETFIAVSPLPSVPDVSAASEPPEPGVPPSAKNAPGAAPPVPAIWYAEPAANSFPA